MRFYSKKDEDALFEWLYKIKSISKIEGIGKELHLSVDIDKLSKDDIKDFVGIFKRYKFKNHSQLQNLSCAKESS